MAPLSMRRLLSAVPLTAALARAHNGMRHCRRKGEPLAAKPRRRGRDAITGRFIPVKVAERRRKTAIVETIKAPKKKGKK